MNMASLLVYIKFHWPSLQSTIFRKTVRNTFYYRSLGRDRPTYRVWIGAIPDRVRGSDDEPWLASSSTSLGPAALTKSMVIALQTRVIG